jgi:hypothetical protein
MRKSHYSKNGFSLTEVLLAIGTLAVGMLFIAGVFPVGIHFTTIATERTIAAVVADEAFAKVRLYALADPCVPADDIALGRLAVNQLTDFNDVANINPIEFAYPSDPNMDISQKQYYWSALCRRVDPDPNSRLVQVTVFVSRKIGGGTLYQGLPGLWPVPVPVAIPLVPSPQRLQIEPGREGFINDGYTIVDDQTGRIYRVLERDADAPDTIVLDRPWQGGPTGLVWVVPPPVGGGKRPCITVYQRVIRF